MKGEKVLMGLMELRVDALCRAKELLHFAEQDCRRLSEAENTLIDRYIEQADGFMELIDMVRK